METQDEDVEVVSTTQEEGESNATNMNGQGDSVVCNGGTVFKLFGFHKV
jgi:hypothetical protein